MNQDDLEETTNGLIDHEYGERGADGSGETIALIGENLRTVDPQSRHSTQVHSVTCRTTSENGPNLGRERRR